MVCVHTATPATIRFKLRTKVECKETHAKPYEGVSNLRPETKALVDLFEKSNGMLK